MSNWWDADKVENGDPYNPVPGAARQVTGEDYLKLLPPEMGGIVKGLAGYKIDPLALSTKGGHRERMLGAAMRYDPEYDQAAFKARAAAIKEFNAGGPSSPAGQITAGNTAIPHLRDMGEAAEELKKMPGFLQRVANSGLPFVSYAAAALKNSSVRGTPEGQALTKFFTAQNHFSEEVTKFYAGAGGSEAERFRALANLDPNKSIEELRAAAKMEADLMSGKVNALQDRFKNALGPKAWLTAIEQGIPQFPILQEKTKKAIEHIYGHAAESEKTKAPASAAPDAEGWVTMPGGVRLREVKPAAPAPTSPGP